MPSSTVLTTRVIIRPESKLDFADWQAKLNALIVEFPGFVSLEISAPHGSVQPVWMIVQRFYNAESIAKWRASKAYKELLEDLKKFLVKNKTDTIQEIESDASTFQGSVTEVFVTQVSSDKEDAYRKWMAKIHQVEAKFPGFRGVYVQSPSQKQGRNWITLLQFDTPENLDRWLNSAERQEVLIESKPLITSLESQRVISPYAGWFASTMTNGGLPEVWKQTMLVLLVLFPIIMLELKYLSPLTAELNPSVATFIGNALSVTLIAWPMMPIAIFFLGWWLSPSSLKHQKITFIGTVIMVLLYFIEIAIFWKLL